MKILKALLSFILFLFVYTISLFPQDSLIYNSEYEEEIFNKYLNKEDVEYENFFFCLNADKNLEKNKLRLQDFIGIMKSKTSKYSVKKKINYIYKNVHENFLSKYDEYACFNDIFIDGRYNCASASALYALVFHDLGINYEIKLTPEHVYIIADPGNTSFFLETTTPSSGVIEFDEKFKSNYIDFLVEDKIIGENEYKTKSINELFIEYYSKDKSINIIQLAGVNYYNEGIFRLIDKKYLEAYHSLEKAGLLYDSDLINFSKISAIIQLLLEENTKKEYSGNSIALLLNSSPDTEKYVEFATEVFMEISYQLINLHPDEIKYRELFEELHNCLNDSIKIDEIDQIYYQQQAIYYYSDFDYQGSLEFISKAYEINPENVNTRQILGEILSKYLSTQMNDESFIELAENYFLQFPYLKSNNILTSLLQYRYAKLIGDSFISGQSLKAEKYRHRLEFFMIKNELADIDPEIVEYAYGQGAVYYFRLGNYAESLNIIEHGLKLAPNSYELKSRKNSINNSGYKKSHKADELSINEVTEIINQAELCCENLKNRAKQFISGIWKLMPDDVDLSEDEIILLEFYEDARIKIKAYGESSEGKWYFNNEECNLKFIFLEEETEIDIFFTDISENVLKGIGFYDQDITDAELLKMIRVSK